MSRIRIKNFGPIKKGCEDNDGWIDIKKVTAFIGNQGSGKSTVAKLISTFLWIEKALVRGEDQKWFVRKNRLKNQFLPYHRLDYYLNKNTEIEYSGKAYNIVYNNESSSFELDQLHENSYILPQIMYIPSERNFLSYVKSPKELRLSSKSLQEFLTEFERAKRDARGGLSLPINKVKLQYDELNDTLNIKGEDFKLRLSHSSSGFQSIVPLYLVSRFLTRSVKHTEESDQEMSAEESDRYRKSVDLIINNNTLSNEQKRIAMSQLASKFNKSAFINIVEEPEQNLFPSSQWELLKSILEFNNDSPGNGLIMTTHSPYIINYLSIAVQAGELYKKLKGSILTERLHTIVPEDSAITADDVAVYQLDEENGTITRLEDYKGIPSDENYLNMGLRHGNELFDKLLEIEEEL